MKSRVILLLCALTVVALPACSNDKNKIGSTVKGTRIAVMQDNKTLDADKELAGQKPQLPDGVSNPDWPQAGYDPTHIMPNANVPAHPAIAWSSDVGEGSDSDFKLLARPVVSKGHVFTMDSQGRVSAFDAASGSRLWDFDTTPEGRDENAIGGGVAVDGDTVYATTGFGELLALNAADGTVKWRKLLGNPLRDAPTIADGRVYAVSIVNELYALDVKNGEELWHHSGIAESATLMGASSPAVLGDSVVVAYSSGEIYDLRAENGRVSWNYGLTTPTQVGALPAIADIRGLPVIDRGNVYAISHSGRMAAIDQRTGDRAWEADVGGVNTPLSAGDTLFVLTNDGQLVALTHESGRILWVHELQHLEDPDDHNSDPVYWAGPILAGGKLWLTNSMGQVNSYSPGGGSQIDSIDVDDPMYISPVAAGNTIYVVTDSGNLVALR